MRRVNGCCIHNLLDSSLISHVPQKGFFYDVYICMMYGLYFKHNLNINIQKKVLCMYILTSSSHHPQLFLTGMFQAARFIEILFSQLSVEILNG